MSKTNFTTVFALALFLILTSACSDDGALFIPFSGSQANFNPGGPGAGGGGGNGGGNGGQTLVCSTHMQLAGTFVNQPAGQTLVQTFYMENQNTQLQLSTEGQCPHWVDAVVTMSVFGVGRYIGPDPFGTSPVNRAVPTDFFARAVKNNQRVAPAPVEPPEVDLFGLNFAGAIFFGTSTPVDATHLGFSLEISERPSYADPNCFIGFSFTNGQLQLVQQPTTDDSNRPTTSFQISADVAISLRHATDLGVCTGLYVTQGLRFQ